VDYLCGTGHGVGYALSVHEGPNAFRWILREDTKDIVALKPGMITTDEPGVYKEGKYGIRLENELLCVPAMDTVYGRMLKFEPVTYVPFDRDAIDVSLLEPADIRRIDEYHAFVYNTMEPHLGEKERIWLKKVTRPLKIGE
jgi:Xaa-Pro aminopeptidase